MKTLILYHKKHGATAQYTEWLHDEIHSSDLTTYDHCKPKKLKEYDRIIFGMPTFSGKISYTDFLVENWKFMQDKLVYLLVVGMVPQDSAWSERSYKAIPQGIRDGIKGYMKLPGLRPKNAKPEPGWFERLMVRVFMKTDPDRISKQDHVRRADLDAFLEMVRSDEYELPEQQ